MKRIPDKFIYDPWMAPTATQNAAKCIVGKDYPSPPFDHTKVSKENMNKMKAAFDANKKTTAAVSDEGPKAKKAKK